MADHLTGGDLFQLWQMSDVQLPRIASVFYQANHEIAGAGGEGALSSVTAYGWQQLREEMQLMFAQVGDAVMAGAEGVRRAARLYVEADLASSEDLERYKRDSASFDPADPAANPPAPGAPDHPTAPILPGH